ncbi:glutamine-hydrolyzing carbamoyl-phosphate synthase small subunit [Filobacillus milosensis]|uniref:Carbamoyl phosphate synthase small chain n=1 Tax=Filobacillus milosensis TaxID=94137 RepID=A0A4Y8INW4_9BACI|nr:carbamoyl phosphate synthase small subunit [Filobacillus milosensis]TFB23273.1 glutamine-hydrolyzing carbamoyl-phosphate synthase small subunit [Filobacillus milosensis]
MHKRYLILEDGSIFEGKAFGATLNEKVGEVVFNTGMTGYQETLSDPSYCDQFVVMTYPLIGNYGINRDDFETIQPPISGLIVKECAEYPSNFRKEWTLHEYLQQKDIPGLANVDTRKLVKIIRQQGTMTGIMTDNIDQIDEIKEKLKETKLRNDQVKRVSTVKPYVVPGQGERIVLVDFGMKHGILREFTQRHCHVTVVPYNITAAEVLQLKPDGVMLSNGPGDPKDVQEGIELVKGLIGKVPVFGICLGHQLIALACGADTHKMKFGHRGSNHPVKDLKTGEVWMTSQNHGYAVTRESLAKTSLKETQVALNDHTVEGLEHEIYEVFSVQYHPESSPGPQDSNTLFDVFLEKVNGGMIHA